MRTIKNALILAGGVNRRFWPLANKSLFNFLGKPLILYQIERLEKYVENVVVVANKDTALAIKRLVENLRSAKVQVVVQKDEYNGQAGAVLSVKNQILGEVVIVNSNDVLDFSCLSKITSVELIKNRVAFFGKKLGSYFPGGYFKFDDSNKPTEVVEKPAPSERPSDSVKLMVDYFSDIKLLLGAIEETKSAKDDHYEQALNKILDEKIERNYYDYDGYWQSLKYPWHVMKMMKVLLGEIEKDMIPVSCQISKKALIVGPVEFGENVKIGDFAKIVGPTYIGDNSVVGDYSLVRESQIGQDCLVGGHTEVARSSIGNGVFLHRNYVGDTVMDDQSMMGAGAVTANFRFDEKNISSFMGKDKIDTGLGKFGAIIGAGSKLGVNVTLTPGVKIGKSCLVAPREIVWADLEDNTFLIDGLEKENLKK